MITKPFAYNPNSGTTYPGTTEYGNIAVATGAVDYISTGLKWWMGPIEDNKYIIARPNLNTLNPRFAGTGNTDAQFLNLTNRLFKTNLPNASSAQTWLLSMGYYTNWQYILTEIFAGSSMSIGIKNGQVWGWGSGYVGELGINSTTNKCTPVSIQGAKKTFCYVTSNFFSTFVIDKNGQLWSWGSNTRGQLGDNTNTNKCTPVSIQGAKKTFCKIFSGQRITFSIDKNNQAWGWGYNQTGTLGDNTSTDRCTPVSILGAKKTFCQIKGGNHSSVGLDNYGQVWGWGYSNFGQIGNNSTQAKYTPVSIQGVKKTFCKVYAGYDFVTALDKNGQVWGWGYNTDGRLGNNSTVSRCTPVSIQGAKKTFCEICSISNYILALDKNGQIWSWGSNNIGQLGDNSTVSRCTPVSIQGIKKTFCKISAGSSHAFALDNNGVFWGWGQNTAGQLGDNSTISRLTPVKVCIF